jgi:hypothetical protein
MLQYPSVGCAGMYGAKHRPPWRQVPEEVRGIS